MRTLKAVILIALLLPLSTAAFAQTSSAIDSLLCKEWKLVFYYEGGEKVLPAPAEKNDRMIFYKDHNVKAIENRTIENGIWQYNETTRTLVIKDNQTKEEIRLEVLKITENECILGFNDPEGGSLKIHMAPVTKK